MTLREKLLIAGATFLVILLAFGFRAFLEARDARTKAEANESALRTIADQAKSQAAAAEADKAKVAADLQVQLAAIEKQKQQSVTPAQFVIDLNKLLPNLPEPVEVVQQPAETKVANGETKPAAPETVVQIPAADLPDLRNYKLDCDASAAKLGACEKTAQDTASQLKSAEIELDAMTKDRDTWKTAAGQGSVWQRLGKRVKCLAIVGGVSALGAAVDKQMPARGAAIGATAGGVGCELF